MRVEQNRNILIPDEFPAIHSEVFSTKKGTLYLKRPGVVIISAPAVSISGMKDFLAGFPEEYNFTDYLEDPGLLTSDEQLIKMAGQTCYASWGPQRSRNDVIEKYIGNLVSSGHGSVLEHACFSVLIYGMSRSCSLEMVRHRAGTAFSQLSQRYVSGKVLRFVERPEYQNDEELHSRFERNIDFAAQEYEKIAQELLVKQISGDQLLSGAAKTDLRKKVQQAARSVLPNETETIMVMTANIRAWRHIINMRASEHAEIEIRDVAYKIFQVLRQVTPNMFADFEVVDLLDGTKGVKTKYPKV